MNTTNNNFFNNIKNTLSKNLIKESRELRNTLYSQGKTRQLSDEDFQNYKLSSTNNYVRSEADLISPIPNEINGVVDLDVLKNLKNFSSTIKNLEEKSATLCATISSSPLPSSVGVAGVSSSPLPSSPTDEMIQKELSELTTKIIEYFEEIMPPQFMQSMLIIPKNQLHKYKLHKIVLLEYNEYIQETCKVVNDISNKLSTHVKSYSYTKNIKRKSRNTFPSFKNKLNEILLKHAKEFGFDEKYQQEKKAHLHHHHHDMQKKEEHLHHHHHDVQKKEEDLHHHHHDLQKKEEHLHHHHHDMQQKKELQKNKKQLKIINRKKIRFMHQKLYEEYKFFKKENPNNIDLDLQEFPPVKSKVASKNKDVKSVDSVFLHYNMQNFKLIEGRYILIC